MPENLTDRNRCHKCDTTGKRKKDKLSKCERCHAITYCSRECQAKDWPRHKDNCVPVMVKEYEGKGRGLVAAKDIKMGELILIDKAVLSNKDIVHYGYDLSADARRLIFNQKILKDIFLLNHSCSPNTAMGLLDGEKNKKPKKRIELRAVKNISKDDEVTIYYPPLHCFRLHADNRRLIKEDFGFDCRCVVCLGQVPNQDNIMERIRDIVTRDDFYGLKDEEKTLRDWKREAIVNAMIFDLSKPLQIGREIQKMKYLGILYKAAVNCGNSILMRKAEDEMKELADKTGLELMKNEVETWRVKETWT